MIHAHVEFNNVLTIKDQIYWGNNKILILTPSLLLVCLDSVLATIHFLRQYLTVRLIQKIKVNMKNQVILKILLMMKLQTKQKMYT
jgi:hypothetical protein